MTDITISVNRQSKHIGIFDGFKLVDDFQRYEDEATAVQQAQERCRAKFNIKANVVYPQITCVRITMSNRRTGRTK